MLRNPLVRAALVVTLAGASSSACIPGSCNCPDIGVDQLIGAPAALDVQITNSGPGCSDPAVCEVSADGGSCTAWIIRLTHTGNCTVAAQAADGQQATLSVNVQSQDLGCCGSRLVTDPSGAFSSFPGFSLADAGAASGVTASAIH